MRAVHSSEQWGWGNMYTKKWKKKKRLVKLYVCVCGGGGRGRWWWVVGECITGHHTKRSTDLIKNMKIFVIHIKFFVYNTRFLQEVSLDYSTNHRSVPTIKRRKGEKKIFFFQNEKNRKRAHKWNIEFWLFHFILLAPVRILQMMQDWIWVVESNENVTF